MQYANLKTRINRLDERIKLWALTLGFTLSLLTAFDCLGRQISYDVFIWNYTDQTITLTLSSQNQAGLGRGQSNTIIILPNEMAGVAYWLDWHNESIDPNKDQITFNMSGSNYNIGRMVLQGQCTGAKGEQLLTNVKIEYDDPQHNQNIIKMANYPDGKIFKQDVFQQPCPGDWLPERSFGTKNLLLKFPLKTSMQKTGCEWEYVAALPNGITKDYQFAIIYGGFEKLKSNEHP